MTSTVPFIVVWIVHRYSKVPATKVLVKLAPGARGPESNPCPVTVWGTESLLVHVTVIPPFIILTGSGWKAKLRMETVSVGNVPNTIPPTGVGAGGPAGGGPA